VRSGLTQPFWRIGHRGAAGLEPENTLRSIEAALRLGVEMVEIDVRHCADGTLVVVHDDDLQRVAGTHARVSALTPAQLRSIDVGEGERIPTLEEALALIRGRAMVNLDQKVDNLTDGLLRAIDRAGKREETILTGEAVGTFCAMRQRAPEIKTLLSLDARRKDILLRVLSQLTDAGARGLAGRLIAAVHAIGTQGMTLDWRLANARVVAQCKRAGLPVLTWTVDDLYTMRVLRAAGVDGITSNRPDILMQVE
jgi:glycerophosphoryl diester phosphodiesterase